MTKGKKVNVSLYGDPSFALIYSFNNSKFIGVDLDLVRPDPNYHLKPDEVYEGRLTMKNNIRILMIKGKEYRIISPY